MKKHNKKGFILIEVVFSMCIFSILFLFIVGMHLNNIRLEKDNYDMYKRIAYMEAVKNEIIYNISKDEVSKLKNKINIINTKSFNMEDLKKDGLEKIISSKTTNSKLYIQVIVADDEKIKIEMHDKNKCYTIDFKR